MNELYRKLTELIDRVNVVIDYLKTISEEHEKRIRALEEKE